MPITNHPEFQQQGFHWRELRNLFAFARRRLVEEKLDEVAGSLTFTSVLALVPMLTIAFAIFTSFPLFNTMRASLEAYFIQSLMPKAISNTILGYLTLFANKATGLSSVGAVALLVTAVAMMSMIERAFNQIWRVKTPRPMMQRVLVYWAILTLGPALIGISLTVTSHVVAATSSAVGASRGVSNLLLTLVSILLTTLVFGFLYLAVPNRQVGWRDAACGGLGAALLFEIAKRLFAEFIARMPSYAMIYGALAAIPLFLVWIYLSWLITLVGAVLTASLPVIKYGRWWHEPATGSRFVDAMSLLRPLIRQRIHGDSALLSVLRLREETRLGFDEIDQLLRVMEEAGWVGKVRGESTIGRRIGKSHREGLDQWALLANPQQLRVADVCHLFVFDGSQTKGAETALAQQVQSVIDLGLRQSLAEWVEA